MKVKDELLKKLLDGVQVSGAKVASEMGVSRNAVWKAVRELQKSGYDIQACGEGYNLIGGNVLGETAIGKYLDCGLDIILLGDTTSTNDEAKRIAAMGGNALVVADSQSAGRGRLGRRFSSPVGTGAYFSVILRPKFDVSSAQLITAYAAVATAEAIEKLCGTSVGIKWVNDLFMNGRKICGILTEASIGIEGNSLDYAVVGIGINVLGEPPIGLENIATTVQKESGAAVDRNRLIAEVTNRLMHIETHIASRDFMDGYRARSICIGRQVRVNGEFDALMLGIEDDGRAVINVDGKTVRLNSGEVSLCVK